MAIDYTVHYAKMEDELRNLLQKVGYLLAKDDLADATDYLAEGEYGLALETIAEGLREPSGQINSSVVEYIAPLAKRMKIKGRPFLKSL